MSDRHADRLAITAQRARYCRCLDTKDWKGFAGALTADVVIDTTGSGGPLMEGRDDVIAVIRRSSERAVTMHQVHAAESEMNGDEATGVWAMHDEIRRPDGRRLSGDGHHHERYRRESGGWRIAASRLTRLLVEMTQGNGR